MRDAVDWVGRIMFCAAVVGGMCLITGIVTGFYVSLFLVGYHKVMP